MCALVLYEPGFKYYNNKWISRLMALLCVQQGSVEYAELNGEQPEADHYYPEVNNYQDLPAPVD